MDRSVHGIGNHLKPGVDPPYFDDLTLSNYCHETICKGPGKRAEILSTFKVALNAARRIRGMAVEVDSSRNLAPEFVEHVIFASIRFDRSPEKTDDPLKYAYQESGDRKNHPVKLDERGVEELFQLHSEAETTILDRCANGELNRELLGMIPMTP